MLNVPAAGHAHQPDGARRDGSATSVVRRCMPMRAGRRRGGHLRIGLPVMISPSAIGPLCCPLRFPSALCASTRRRPTPTSPASVSSRRTPRTTNGRGSRGTCRRRSVTSSSALSSPIQPGPHSWPKGPQASGRRSPCSARARPLLASYRRTLWRSTASTSTRSGTAGDSPGASWRPAWSAPPPPRTTRSGSACSRRTRAQRFYEKMGFVPVGNHPFVVGGVPDNDFVLARPVQPASAFSMRAR